MNTEPIIIAALTGIVTSITPPPAPQGLEEYILFNDSDNRATGYADDIDVEETAWVQIHYFTKSNPKTKSKSIRKALRNAGFIYLNTQLFYEDDTGFYHTIIEAYITDASETQEEDY